MVRRTKQDAELTRNSLLDAAQEVFYAKGVAGASLAEIAKAASLTRGAIYWHFKDKADLFDAMMQRVTLPFEQAWSDERTRIERQHTAISRILEIFQMVLHSVCTDPVTRRVFDIALYKVECVGEMLAVRERRLAGLKRFTSQMENELCLAAREAQVQLPIPVQSAAKGLQAVFEGILHTWLLDAAQTFDLEYEGMTAVKVYLKGLGLEAGKINYANLPKLPKCAG